MHDSLVDNITKQLESIYCVTCKLAPLLLLSGLQPQRKEGEASYNI
jgi:hypothetical protein